LTIADPVEERWRETWSLVPGAAPGEQLARLCSLYSQRHRAYHTLEHVLACLALASTVRDALHDPAAVELALWYHDAIYEPRAADNEPRSADLAEDQLISLVPPATVGRIRTLILVTRHDAQPADPDAQAMVDIDLSILGAEPPAFDEYERQVRREYRWVPRPIFRSKRREILQAFLDRPRIYSTARFHSELEERARANLARSIARLS
jgi:predicted metal-dependent HD superfamily phosphohydrolase